MQGVLLCLGWENIVPTSQHTIYYCSKLFLRIVYTHFILLSAVQYIGIHALWILASCWMLQLLNILWCNMNLLFYWFGTRNGDLKIHVYLRYLIYLDQYCYSSAVSENLKWRRKKNQLSFQPSLVYDGPCMSGE